ncbi:class I SAM-dependent methyltransferase, partial [Candidatus Parcubacteria bacterium]
MQKVNSAQTRYVRAKYDRTSRYYNLLEWPMERLFYQRWRRQLFARLQGRRVLEVGLGTGKNLPFYSEKSLEAVGLDFSEGMLRHALPLARRMGIPVVQGDVQRLPFGNDCFDAVIATFVFCSVPDPVLGFGEIRRVLKPAGRLYLLEHVLPESRIAAKWFNRLNGLAVRMMGANINRTTARNLQHAGFEVEDERHLLSSVFRMFVARP